MALIKPKLSREVAETIAAGGPVVALESTIITHGMPYPANLETALGVEAVIRENGAVPATIAVINGELRVGLEHSELEELAQAKGVVKPPAATSPSPWCAASRRAPRFPRPC